MEHVIGKVIYGIFQLLKLRERTSQEKKINSHGAWHLISTTRDF